MLYVFVPLGSILISLNNITRKLYVEALGKMSSVSKHPSCEERIWPASDEYFRSEFISPLIEVRSEYGYPMTKFRS